ncbi:hypothetical protein [Gaoshiqia sediminis]|uniref:Uncharacterized protein n=1 Tax=Gaoshiqia sediminis TaxID=2986998 RepID=A0AA41Y6K2_9BACT|nr:hypothetical protein [Gaoshiqia sediminis]MCW0481843.1 hypothetical protein [Gaoshiqia sediminis]
MKKVLIVISFIGLVLTIVPSILVFKQVIAIETHFHLMVAGMFLWFGTSPFWMKTKSLDDEEKA